MFMFVLCTINIKLVQTFVHITCWKKILYLAQNINLEGCFYCAKHGPLGPWPKYPEKISSILAKSNCKLKFTHVNDGYHYLHR